MFDFLKPSIEIPEMSTGTDLVPFEPSFESVNGDVAQVADVESLSPMQSLLMIFEEIRDGINELVLLARESAAPESFDRDTAISAADTGGVTPSSDTDSQGNKFNFPEVPEVGPKLGLALMLGGLVALFEFSDEIAKAIEPVLEIASKVVDAVGVKGLLYSGLAAVAAIKFGKPLLTLLGNGPKAISTAFSTLTEAFSGMRKFLFDTAPKNIKAAYGAGTQFFTKAFNLVKGAFISMQLFLTKTLVPTLTTAFAPLSAALLPVTLAIAAAVAVFVSIKAGIDEFKASLEQGDSLLVAIIEGVSTALLTLVTLPITLMTKAAAFIAEKLGFEEVAKKLKDLDIVEFIKNGVKALVFKATDFVLGLFDIDFNQVLGKFIDIGKSIGNVLNGIAQGSIAAIKAAFPGGESPMEAFKRVYGEVTSGQEPRMPVEENIDTSSMSDEELKAEQEKLEKQFDTNLSLESQAPLSDEMLKIQIDNQDKLGKVLDDLQKEMDERAETGGAVNTVIQDNKTVTNNTTNNTEQTPDLSVDATDAVAKALAFRGYGMAY